MKAYEMTTFLKFSVSPSLRSALVFVRLDLAFIGALQTFLPDLLRLVVPHMLHCGHFLDNSHKDKHVNLQQIKGNPVNETFTSANEIINLVHFCTRINNPIWVTINANKISFKGQRMV